MREFNLMTEPWISVMVDDKGRVEDVSLMDVFQNAHRYIRLAGETPQQDFAILRFLLAVTYTVFSRFDAGGDPYEWLETDERFLQKNAVDEFDEEDYLEALNNTWRELWQAEALPDIIQRYLDKWAYKFNLFDDTYPFMQITEDNMAALNISRTGDISPKLINRLISESNNKICLFSPASDINKNRLTDAELARWMIAFQAYTGTGDKAKFPGMNATASKGWLMGLGAIYLMGNNLKETLLLNLVPPQDVVTAVQTPLWEQDIQQATAKLLSALPVNTAELYTNMSRLICVREKDDRHFEIKAVQLPGMNPQEFFLEKMTLWRFAKSGNDKDHYIPKIHETDQSLWRSFRYVVGINDEGGKNIRPGIIDWYRQLVIEKNVNPALIQIVAVGISYNKDASTMPNDEIYDEINIHNVVLADVSAESSTEAKSHWVDRIVEEVHVTKETIEMTLKYFIKRVNTLRNVQNDGFADMIVKEAYFDVDLPFRNWISSIRIDDSKEEKIKEWRDILKRIILNKGNEMLSKAGKRDFVGRDIQINGKGDKVYSNIEIEYNRFLVELNRRLS